MGGNISHDGKGNYFCPHCASSWKAERKRLWWPVRVRYIGHPPYGSKVFFSRHFSDTYGEGPERRRYVQCIRFLWVFVLILGDGYQPKVMWHEGMRGWWPVEWIERAKRKEEDVGNG